MSEFSNTHWAKPEFSSNYIDNADIYIVERRSMFRILQSFYRHFLNGGRQKHVLDLGCGDGIGTHELLKVDRSISPTLVDASEDMLSKAKERLKDFKNIHYIKASFEDVSKKNILQEEFDFIFSSMAIHHLALSEKETLFKAIHSHLNSDGHFLSIDVVLAPTSLLDTWYMGLWREWMDEQRASLGKWDEQTDAIIRRYKDNKDNKPDTLEAQLDVLKNVGFKDVDCFYKYGIFSIFGGRK